MILQFRERAVYVYTIENVIVCSTVCTRILVYTYLTKHKDSMRYVPIWDLR